MMKGFFEQATLSKAPLPLVPQCGICKLYKDCNSPKMKVHGQGKRKILIVGEAGGKTEDLRGIPFIGASGKILRETLAKFKVDTDRDCWITNALICRPHTDDDKNRTPTEREIEYCRPNVVNAIKELKPEIIILLGGSAVKSVLGWLWKEDVGKISRWDGWQIPSQKVNAYVCPTWHPAFLLYDDQGSGKQNEVRKLFFEKHIKAAVELKGKPWETVPDFRKQVKVVFDHQEAAALVRGLTAKGKPLAWDLECEGLKPDNEELRIHSCSVSDGEVSVSFPWHGEAIKAVREFLLSDVPKIAQNAKYENRWVKAKLGIDVVNWRWDTMVTAHVLDNRGSIASLKFQAFVLLGQLPYEEAIKPFLEAKGSNARNRIKEADLRNLLLYGGLDSLLTRRIAQIQAKKVGVEL